MLPLFHYFFGILKIFNDGEIQTCIYKYIHKTLNIGIHTYGARYINVDKITENILQHV